MAEIHEIQKRIDPRQLNGWGLWHAQKSNAKRAWELSRAGWWRAQCDRELKQAIAQARRGVRESALRVTWGVERVLVAEIDLASRKGVLSASCATVARKAGVCRRTVTYVNRELERLGVLRRHSSGGAKFGPDGRIASTASNVYRLNHQQLRRLLGIPLRGQSVYEAADGPMTRAMRALADGAARAYERHRMSPFHVCSAAGHPWHDERGFTRSRSLTREEFKRLYSRWKSPGRARVCAVINEKNVKGINLRRKSCLRQRDDRLARALALLRPLCSRRAMRCLDSIAALSPSLAVDVACDAVLSAKMRHAGPQAADWAVVRAAKGHEGDIRRAASMSQARPEAQRRRGVSSLGSAIIGTVSPDGGRAVAFEEVSRGC